jgi:hypothetical protein
LCARQGAELTVERPSQAFENLATVDAQIFGEDFAAQQSGEMLNPAAGVNEADLPMTTK